MKLKRCNQILHYEGGKITEYELLTRYNPRFINGKIQAIQYQINAMYSLNQSHVVSCDVRGVISVSYPVDKLVIWIIEQKEALERYKTASSGNLATLKRIVSRYTPQEQKDIIRYMASNGRYRPIGVIERLQVDLYRTVNNARQKRNRGRREAQQRAVSEHVALIKQTINKEREVLAI
ncbi:pathogenicity island protein [Macrococcus equipercicus]|uniref:Pathogenicity island protein n=1 Tax=Macrococcus equipercicus TaxID=69967 RepID=A0ABQ6R8L8_9STAP|nr:pathogenicity island protein [Macrococcus equipercicus]KAA1039480.1 pathogenicity island protein [Macrococcus equipercicus]